METYIDENGNERDFDGKIIPYKKEVFAALSGRSKRRLMRQNTVHLDGYCPSCGGRCRWKKAIANGYGSNGKVNYIYNKWQCQNPGCKKTWDRKDFKYVKHQYV